MGCLTLKPILQRLGVCFVGTVHLHRHSIMFKMYMQIKPKLMQIMLYRIVHAHIFVTEKQPHQ